MPADRPRRPYVLLGLAAVVMAFPLYAFARWVAASSAAESVSEAVARFRDSLPAALRPRGRFALTSASACLAAAVIAAAALRALSSLARYAAALFVVLALVLGVWSLWRLM